VDPQVVPKGSEAKCLCCNWRRWGRKRTVLEILAMYFHAQQLNRFINKRNRYRALISAALLCMRNDPSGVYGWQGSLLYRTIYMEPNHFDFKRMSQRSRPAFEVLVTNLSRWSLKSKAVTEKKAEFQRKDEFPMKSGCSLFLCSWRIWWYYRRCVWFKSNTALKCARRVAKIITAKTTDKWMLSS
jgi:hypothetical protein